MLKNNLMNKNYILPVFIVMSGVIAGVSFGYHSTLEKNSSNDSMMVPATVESSTLVLYTNNFEIQPNNEQSIMDDLPVIIRLMENRTK